MFPVARIRTTVEDPFVPVPMETDIQFKLKGRHQLRFTTPAHTPLDPPRKRQKPQMVRNVNSTAQRIAARAISTSSQSSTKQNLPMLPRKNPTAVPLPPAPATQGSTVPLMVTAASNTSTSHPTCYGGGA